MHGKPPPGKPFDICERTFQFALRALDITAALPHQKEAQVVRDQLSRAGTSVGSNTEEAEGAITKKERRKFLGIARREALESRYFLRITHHRWSNFVRVESDIREISEIRNILSAMIRRIDEAA